jgi:hypothetical protein
MRTLTLSTIVLLFTVNACAADFTSEARKAYKTVERMKRSIYAPNVEYQPRKLDAEKATDDLEPATDADRQLAATLNAEREHIDLARFFNDQARNLGSTHPAYTRTVVEQQHFEAVADSCSADAATLLDGGKVAADSPCQVIAAKKVAKK